MLPSVLLLVTNVRESKSSINDPLDWFNPCKYLSGSRKRLLWILTWDCLELSLDMIPFGKIVDRLVKIAHFIPIKMTYIEPQLVELYSSSLVCFHGVPMRIVSDSETQLILTFWEWLHETFNTHLNFSSAYYTQTNGQTEHVNEILQNMLRVSTLQ
jgi:hypothetical protein